jgi:hypothetical protein
MTPLKNVAEKKFNLDVLATFKSIVEEFMAEKGLILVRGYLMPLVPSPSPAPERGSAVPLLVESEEKGQEFFV